MAGILKVDQYQDFNGNNIMTSDGAGNVTIPVGVVCCVQNYSSIFMHRLNASQSRYIKCCNYKSSMWNAVRIRY